MSALLRTLAVRARLPLHCLAAAWVALLLTLSGPFGRLETAVSDVATFSRAKPPSGGIALVVVDARTIQRTGRYPYDRRLLAEALDRLREAGAARIYLDAALSSPEGPAEDAALAEALARLGPERVALPAIAISASPRVEIRPLDIFRRSATLVSADIPLDGDRRSRQILGDDEIGPLVCDWLLGRTEKRAAPLLVDFAFAPEKLPRYDMTDIAAGRFDRAAFRGRGVILGHDIASPAVSVAAPLHGPVRRIEYFALGTETLAGEDLLNPLPPQYYLLVLFLVAVVAAPAILLAGAFGGFVLVAGATAAWMFYLPQMQAATHALLPTASVGMTLAILWQASLFRDSRLALAMRRRLSRVFGLGREALITAVDAISEPALVIDGAGAILAHNAAFESLAFAREPDRFQDLVPEAAGKTLVGLEHADIEAPPRVLEAKLRWVETLTSPVAIAVLADVTEARRQVAAQRDIAFRDELTRLLNRRGFEAALADLTRAPGPLAVLLIDLDGFKQVNDTLGHHAGDAILAAFAALAVRLKGLADVAGRLGGDEFALVLPGGSAEAGEALAWRLIEGLREPIDIDGTPARVGASIGVAVREGEADSAADLLKRADAAMYAAKRGRAGVRVHGRGEASEQAA